MILIREIAYQALNTGYLTLEAEEQLRQLLQTKYSSEDLKAFMKLQLAAMAGLVKQESRESRSSCVYVSQAGGEALRVST